MKKVSDSKIFTIKKVHEKTMVPRVTLRRWDLDEILKAEIIPNKLSGTQDRYYSEKDILKALLLKAMQTPENMSKFADVIISNIEKENLDKDTLLAQLNLEWPKDLNSKG